MLCFESQPATCCLELPLNNADNKVPAPFVSLQMSRQAHPVFQSMHLLGTAFFLLMPWSGTGLRQLLDWSLIDFCSPFMQERLGNLTNKCMDGGAADLEYFVQESAHILGLQEHARDAKVPQLCFCA